MHHFFCASPKQIVQKNSRSVCSRRRAQKWVIVNWRSLSQKSTWNAQSPSVGTHLVRTERFSVTNPTLAKNRQINGKCALVCVCSTTRIKRHDRTLPRSTLVEPFPERSVNSLTEHSGQETNTPAIQFVGMERIMTPFLYIALGIALGSMIKSANEAKPEDKYETEQDSIVS